jgi:carbon-monoxide dehydrogenase small subunit
MVMAAKALLDREPNPSEQQVRTWLAGNLCRCTGYDKIIRSVQAAARQMAEQGPADTSDKRIVARATEVEA